jgi:hypothetical protein
VKGFACAAGMLWLDAEALTQVGLWAKPVADESEFVHQYDGVGKITAVDSGVVVSQVGAQQAGALVLVDTTFQPVDQGFSFEQTEGKQVLFVNNLLYVLAKDWKTGEFLVMRGALGLLTFEQLGERFKEAGMSLYTDGKTVWVLTNKNAVTGTGCWQASATAGPDEVWTECPDFPQYVKYKESDPYSVKADVFGAGDRLALWFKVNDKGQETYRHYVKAGEGQWTEASGFPARLPSASLHLDSEYLVGYTGSGSEAAVFIGAGDGGAVADATGKALPEAADKSGALGLCRMDDVVYLAWLDFVIQGSTVTVYKLTQP